MYLVNPNGEFVDYYGQNRNKDQCVSSILINVAKWNALNKKGWLSQDEAKNDGYWLNFFWFKQSLFERVCGDGDGADDLIYDQK